MTHTRVVDIVHEWVIVKFIPNMPEQDWGLFGIGLKRSLPIFRVYTFIVL